jgi:hypothetical protein
MSAINDRKDIYLTLYKNKHPKFIRMRIVFVLFLILVTNCAFSQDSIFVEEIPENLIGNEHRFDLDNKIYPVGKEFLFKFSISKNDTILESETDLIKLDIIGTTKPFSEFDSSYSQTVIQFTYFDKNKKLLLTEKTGLIENDTNIWFHPPRFKEAGILQLSAFPYIKHNKQQKWTWKLEAGFEKYTDVHLIHYYQREKTIEYKSASLGALLCEEIIGKSESQIGTTHSYFLYNGKIGFVLLEYFNIDGSKITLTLIK